MAAPGLRRDPPAPAPNRDPGSGDWGWLTATAPGDPPLGTGPPPGQPTALRGHRPRPGRRHRHPRVRAPPGSPTATGAAPGDPPAASPLRHRPGAPRTTRGRPVPAPSGRSAATPRAPPPGPLFGHLVARRPPPPGPRPQALTGRCPEQQQQPGHGAAPPRRSRHGRRRRRSARPLPLQVRPRPAPPRWAPPPVPPPRAGPTRPRPSARCRNAPPLPRRHWPRRLSPQGGGGPRCRDWLARPRSAGLIGCGGGAAHATGVERARPAGQSERAL